MPAGETTATTAIRWCGRRRSTPWLTRESASSVFMCLRSVPRPGPSFSPGGITPGPGCVEFRPGVNAWISTKRRWPMPSRKPVMRPERSENGTMGANGRTIRWPVDSTSTSVTRLDIGESILTHRLSTTVVWCARRAISSMFAPTARLTSSSAIGPDLSFATSPSPRPILLGPLLRPTGPVSRTLR